MEYRDGATYEGSFHLNLRHGNGVLVTKLRDEYRGVFEGDQIVKGTVKTSLYEYEGDLRNFRPNGRGVYKNNFGTFTGNFRDGSVAG